MCLANVSYLILFYIAVVKLLNRIRLFCDPEDYSLPSSSIQGILQARILELVATSSSRGSSRPRNQTSVSCIAGGFFTTEPPWDPQFYFIEYITQGFCDNDDLLL